MERALAEHFASELALIGDSFNRLHELIQSHIHVEGLQKEFRQPLGEAMAVAAMMMIEIGKLYPDLAPRK